MLSVFLIPVMESLEYNFESGVLPDRLSVALCLEVLVNAVNHCKFQLQDLLPERGVLSDILASFERKYSL